MYSKNEIIFRILRNDILKKNEFEKIMNEMIILKKTNFKKISKNLWMNNNHLKSLYKSGHEIGLHAYDHPYDLKNMSYKEQYSQLNKNYKHIKSIINYKPISIAYPNGSFNKVTIDILKKMGVKIGFCSNMKNIISNNNLKNFFFPRMDHFKLL